MLIASERRAELPLIKLADFGVSLLTSEGSGPIPVGPPRKPSAASLRGGLLTPPTGVPTAATMAPSSESLSPTRGLPPPPKLYSVGEDDDDGADTSSLSKIDVADAETQAGDASDLKDTAPRPLMGRDSSGPTGGSDGLASAASLDAADPHMLRPSQGSMSRMLAAEESAMSPGLLTQTDTLIGTPMYMAPELWNTGSHRAEPLSDIFSIGVIAFELLTGRMPFAVPPVMSRANDEPIYIARLSQVRPDLEPRLLALVDSCLSLNPQARLRASELTRRLIELGAQLPQI